MNELVDLVRAELAEAADAEPAPVGLADRALAGVRRRRVRRAVTVGAAGLAAAALVGAVPFLLPDRGAPQDSAAGAGQRSVVYATTSTNDGPWKVLDPKTGRYRTVDVEYVSLPTADLRYSMVTPHGYRPYRTSRIGRYESATGQIRWYELPAEMSGAASISPDGRYAAGISLQPKASIEVLDLSTGKATQVDIPGAARLKITDTNQVLWQAGSRHLLVDNVVVDLAGQVTATFELPRATRFLSLRPDGTAQLVVGNSAMPHNVFILADQHAALIAGVAALEPSCHPSLPIGPSGSPSPGGANCNYDFLGWRGPESLLVQVAFANGPLMFELSLRNGAMRAVHPPIPDTRYAGMVVAPVVNRADVVYSATF
jgi:hypothetical protein